MSQNLQLNLIAVLGAVDKPPVSCMLFYIWYIVL